MKILFFTQGKSVPSSRFRVQQFIPGLEGKGYECEVLAPYPSVFGDVDSRAIKGLGRQLTKPFSILSRAKQLSEVNNFDLVYVQKPMLRYGMTWCESYVHSRKPFIFDLDDALFHNAGGLSGIQVKKIARMANHIVAGNPYISDYIGMPEKTSIVPTVIDTNRYAFRADPDGAFTLGWTGSHQNLKELKPIESTLKKVLRKTNGKLVIICNGSLPSWLRDPQIEHIVWSPQTEVEALNKIHVGLMPLKDTKYNRGKCGFKLIQCMARGIPVVTTPLEVNQQIVRNSIDGFWADDEKSWEEALLKLSESKDLRVQMGKSAREQIERNYSVESAIPKLDQIFQQFKERTSSISDFQTGSISGISR